MRRLPTAAFALAALAVALPACVIRLGGGSGSGVDSALWGWSSNMTIDGHDVRDDDGVLTVDGKELRYDRWVDMPLAAGCCDLLELATITGPVDVTGQAGDGTLRVRLWSEIEGDGTVSLEKGRVVADGSGAVFVNEIAGTIPHGLSVRACTGTGAVLLHGLQQAARVEVESGTGEVQLAECHVGSFLVDSGTGDVVLRGGQVDQVSLSSGTGELLLAGARLGQVLAETGTGDVSVRECIVQRLQASSGTGDVVVNGGSVQELHHDLGTGEVYLRGGVTVGLPD